MKKKIEIIALIMIISLTACGDRTGQNITDTEVSEMSAAETVTETGSTESVSAAETAEVSADEEEIVPVIKPEIVQIRNICELATIQCCYNNVAKGVKEKGTGLKHIGEKDRTVWIEYSGTAKIGIDMSEIKMEVKDTNITITIPKAKILDIEVDPESYNEDSYVISEDGINPNPFTSADDTKIMSSAEENMERLIFNNKTLLINAQDRAKKLIENYINQVGEITEVKYNITWEYE